NCSTGYMYSSVNRSCVSFIEAIYNSLFILNSTNVDTNGLADALEDYYEALTNIDITENSSLLLDANQLDHIIDMGININIMRNTSDLFLLSSNDTLIIGAVLYSYLFHQGGDIITNSNVNNFRPNISSAVIVNNTVQLKIQLLKFLLIKKPDNYKQYDKNDTILISSVIIVSINLIIEQQADIMLYFSPIYNTSEITPTTSLSSLQCSFWDGNGWNQTGCKLIGYNSIMHVYECYCTHATTFALLWLPLSEICMGNI
ncbi:unnamed protein product, partial [Didymodactylos carnosus]